MRCANGLVISALIDFAKDQADVRFTLDIHPRRELSRHLREERCDICVYLAPLQIRGVELLEDRAFRLQVLLPKDHPLARKPFLNTSDLQGLKYIALKRALTACEAVEATLSKSSEHLDVFHEVSSANAAHSLVVDGLGFTFSDPSVLEPAFSAYSNLVPWRTDVSLRVGVYSVENHIRYEATDDFLECLRKPLDAMTISVINNIDKAFRIFYYSDFEKALRIPPVQINRCGMPQKTRNQLILMSEEHTRKVIACYGNANERTPHLDALAWHGTMFTNA